MSKFRYKVIAQSAETIYVIKKSKFIASAIHVNTPEEVQSSISKIQSIHPKAGHHCYAYRLGLDQNIYRANDDGEPSGTAGRPILGQIDSKDLTDTLVVVTRYFGGVKLGASGLISAYKTAAKLVLEEASFRTKKVLQEVHIGTDLQHINILLSQAKKVGFEIGAINYDPRPSVVLKAPLEEVDSFIDTLKAKTLNMSVEQARTIEDKDVFHIFDPS